MSTEMIISILGVLLAISEILGTFDMFKNSSIFGVVVDVLKKIKEFFVGKKP